MNRGIIFWRKVALVHGIRNEATSMKLYEPCFAAQFHCLAGACPDTCCKDWEIILDEKTLARYRALPGVFGDEVRACLTTDAEGDTMFRLTDGHCPLLSSDGLCRVQLSLGEEALCDTCRAHPRFYEEYGQTKELTLSISCPAAIDLLFAQEITHQIRLPRRRRTCLRLQRFRPRPLFCPAPRTRYGHFDHAEPRAADLRPPFFTAALFRAPAKADRHGSLRKNGRTSGALFRQSSSPP